MCHGTSLVSFWTLSTVYLWVLNHLSHLWRFSFSIATPILCQCSPTLSCNYGCPWTSTSFYYFIPLLRAAFTDSNFEPLKSDFHQWPSRAYFSSLPSLPHVAKTASHFEKLALWVAQPQESTAQLLTQHGDKFSDFSKSSPSVFHAPTCQLDLFFSPNCIYREPFDV